MVVLVVQDGFSCMFLALATTAGRLGSARTVDWSTCTTLHRHRGLQVGKLLTQLLGAPAE